MSQIDFSNIASVPTPPSGKTTLFVDSADKHIKTKDDAGNVSDYFAASNAITALTGEVTASGAGSVPATVSNAAVLAKVLTGFVESNGDVLASDSILQAIQKLAGRKNNHCFGNGVDGDVVITSNTTLVRDMYYNNLTINPAVTLSTGGFRIFVANNFINNGIVDRSGSNASLGTGGVALAAGTLAATIAGGTGGTTAAGTAGTASATSVCGAGGAGGAGGSTAGGAAGLLTLVTIVNGGVEIFNQFSTAVRARDLANTLVTSGSGGGGGGGNGTGNQGGGGGGGGGVILVSAKSLTGSGAIKANGGNGADAASGVNGGGGGGGGGGCIILVSENDTTATSLTVQVNGGAAGTGNGTGANGVGGSVGRIYRIRS